jgi:hypothetical protein
MNTKGKITNNIYWMNVRNHLLITQMLLVKLARSKLKKLSNNNSNLIFEIQEYLPYDMRNSSLAKKEY